MPVFFTTFSYFFVPIVTTFARRYMALIVGAMRSMVLSISGRTR